MSRKQKETAITQTLEAARPTPAVSEHMDTLQRTIVQSGVCQGQNLEQEDSAAHCNNTAADCPNELKFRTEFHYGTAQMFKVKVKVTGSKFKVTA